LFFAVDADFPLEILPSETGLILANTQEAELLREAPWHLMPPARRRAVMQRFAMLAALRLAALQDPQGVAAQRAFLAVE
jgi:hypothetical protein